MLLIDTDQLDESADKLTNSEVYWVYNALDCCVTYDVMNVIEPQLDDVSRATYNTSMATLPVLLEMMLEGLPVNLDQRHKVLRHYEDELARLEKYWVRLCHEGLGIPRDRTKRTGGRSAIPINPASPKDLQYLFYTVLQIPEKKRRKKGSTEATVITDRDTLESLRADYFAEVFVNFVLAMRDCAKAIGFLRTKLDADNRIRCSFNVAGTKTGRLNSSFSDSGTGFSDAALAHGTDLFFTEKEGGMGVGLNIVSSIVAAHGGRIELKNDPKGGAVIIVSLPSLAA